MPDCSNVDPATGWDLDLRIGSLPTLRTLERGGLPFILLFMFAPDSWFWATASLAAVWSSGLALAYGMQARALLAAPPPDGAHARQLRIEFAVVAIVGGLVFGVGSSLLGVLDETAWQLAPWQRTACALAGATGLMGTARTAWLLRSTRS